MSLADEIWELLEAVWNFLKKIILRIINFVDNIVSWFRDPSRFRKIQQDHNKVAFALKQKLANNEYNVVVGVFDEQREEILTEDTVVYQAEELDRVTLKNFGNKDLIILK